MTVFFHQQERQGYLTMLKDSLQTRFKSLTDASMAAAAAAASAAAAAAAGHTQPRLLDQLFQNEDDSSSMAAAESAAEQMAVDSWETALVPVVALVTKMCTQVMNSGDFIIVPSLFLFLI